jgi:hypothetical protein
MKRMTFLTSVLAGVLWFAAAAFLAKWTIAWLGKSNTKWQVVSLICAFFTFRAVAGA